MFALVNSYIKPIVKALSMPIGLLTLGLVAFVINAAMLLLVALASDALEARVQGRRRSRRTINSDAIVGAIVGAIIISVVSTLASVALVAAEVDLAVSAAARVSAMASEAMTPGRTSEVDRSARARATPCARRPPASARRST